MKKVIIMGAAGRDFHNFNMYYRNDPSSIVVAFTATQIPGIENRVYPQSLAGKHYPKGIPIYPESQLKQLILENDVDEVVFSYSDVSHEYVMHKASQVLAYGADFKLLGTKHTMLKSTLPVIAITAVRTGAGKSQTSRYISQILKEMGQKAVAIRHPMPYADLEAQRIQRFETYDDLNFHKCTIEEREEYEPHIDNGIVVYAGVDYELILREAEKEADVIIWDGGNNDFSFVQPDITLVILDPLRVGNEKEYYPGESNLYLADVAIINKVNVATKENINILSKTIKETNPNAILLLADSHIYVENANMIKNKKVLVIEDGPSLTHGQMSFGAGYMAAKEYGAKEIIDPRPYAVGSIKDTFDKWEQTTHVVPAMGYSKKQIQELEATINNTPADVVVMGTPIDLSRIINIKHPTVRVRYNLEEKDTQLKTIISKSISK